MSGTVVDHVESILADTVRVRCVSARLRARLRELGACAEGQALAIAYGSQRELAEVLAQLQQLRIAFADAPGGWSPAAVFAQLREEGLVAGRIDAVSWAWPGRPHIRVA
ncbi:MAG TPA: hypothetical protein DDZ67_03875 [Xanthomonadaceae bacterium]|nr:hypothetical protein [Xanthomonadaceae bacterium]